MYKWTPTPAVMPVSVRVNTLRPRQNGRHFADDISTCIFFNENVWITIKISLKFVPKGSINNIPALVQIMVWRHPGAKPLSEPLMVSLLTYICVTRPQWVNIQGSINVLFNCIYKGIHYWHRANSACHWSQNRILRFMLLYDFENITLSFRVTFVLSECIYLIRTKVSTCLGHDANSLECDFTNSTVCGWTKADDEEVMRWSRVVHPFEGMILQLKVFAQLPDNQTMTWSLFECKQVRMITKFSL